MANGDTSGHAAVLVSLHPRFATAVAHGRKTVELRRRFPQVAPGTRLVIYATLPVGAVVGTAIITCVDSDTPNAIWDRHAKSAAITREEFDAYFTGTGVGRGVVLMQYTPLAVPVSLAQMRELGLEPPQGFVYLTAHELTRLTSGA